MARMAKQNGAKLVIVILGNDENPVQLPAASSPGDSIVLDFHAALLENLSVVNREAYLKAYAHWRGSPSRIVDRHPNETAHKIIAVAIVQKVQDDSKTSLDHRGRSGTQ